MFKPVSILISGMLSFFNATYALQRCFFATHKSPVVFAEDPNIKTIQGVAETIHEYGLSFSLTLIFGACLFFGIRFYISEMKERERKKEDELKSKDETIKKLLEDNISLSKEVAALKEKNASLERR